MSLVLRHLVAVAIAVSLSGAAKAQVTTTSADKTIQAIRNSAGFKAASANFDREYERIVAETILLTEIPAPPFKESAKAEAYMAMLKAAGLSDVEMDVEGNVMGLRRGTGLAGAQLVVMAAHLDTVFP